MILGNFIYKICWIHRIDAAVNFTTKDFVLNNLYPDFVNLRKLGVNSHVPSQSRAAEQANTGHAAIEK